MRNAKGLTWLEAIVIVAMLLLLVALLLPTAGRARESTGGPNCGGNLSGIGKALTIYADQNNNRLPNLPASDESPWLSDESPAVLQAILGNGPSNYTAKFLYCPKNPDQNPEQMANWNGITVMGYAFLNDRGADAKNMPQNFPARNPALSYVSGLKPGAAPPDQELALDWIVSDSSDGTKARFRSIRRPGSPPLTYSASHFASRYEPSGGNVLCADGSVRWRNFNPAKAIAIKQPGSAHAYFWIPDP